MGGGTADERPTGLIPSPEHIPDHRCHEIASLPIPDELLGKILVRLPTPADLVRASAVCVSFRRVAADRFFLRLYRKLHAPPLVGFLERRKLFHPAIALNPSASAASAVALAAEFSFSFLPAPAGDWAVRDIRDGRVLLDRPMRVQNSTIVFPEVVVCDPLYRRYLLLPPISCDLASSLEDPFLTKNKRLCFHIFLLPSEEAADADETSFRLIWMTHCKTRLVTFVFSSNTRQWRALPSRRWIDLSADLPELTPRSRVYSHHYVHGCFYFAMTADSEIRKLLVLDVKTMEFSITKPPPEANRRCDFVMVEAGQGRPGMLVLPDSGSDISYFIRQNHSGSSSQWQKVKTISLGSKFQWICNVEKYPLLCQGKGEGSLLEAFCICLTPNIETLQLEKVCALGCSFDRLRAYNNFPPSLLSSPTVSSELRRRCCNKTLLQAQVQSHHSQGTVDANA